LDHPGELKRLKVKAELRFESQDAEEIKREMKKAIQKNLGIESEVELVTLGSLGRSLFKAQRVIKTYS